MRSTIWTTLAALAATAVVAAGSLPALAGDPGKTPDQAQTDTQRTGEISNPDDTTMVYLYYDLTGLGMPVDQWIENDSRVRSAPGADKAKTRKRVRSEIEASSQAVRNIGRIRLKMNADLSSYDPDYEEFTIGALAPSSSVIFQAHSKRILVQFSNAQKAQVWKVSRDKSQGILDRIGDSYARARLTVNILAQIENARPYPQGGLITAKVLSYELRDPRSGRTINRVRVAQQ